MRNGEGDGKDEVYQHMELDDGGDGCVDDCADELEVVR